MATQTEHLGLHQWEPGDSFLRTDFNEDFAKIDAAVKTKGNCQIATGSYVGTGSYGAEHPNVLDFAGTVGKAPLLLFVFLENSSYNLKAGRDMGKCPSVYSPTYIFDSWCTFTWTSTGVRWYNEKNAEYQLNDENMTYRYIALF